MTECPNRNNYYVMRVYNYWEKVVNVPGLEVESRVRVQWVVRGFQTRFISGKGHRL